MKKIKLILRISLDIYRMVPVALLASTIYVVIESIWNAISPAILSVLFDQVAKREAVQYLPTVLVYVVLYAVVQITQIIGSIADNNGIYEKCNLLLRTKFIRHTGELSPLYYEEHSNLVQIERARACITEEVIPNVWRCFIEALGSTMTIGGLIYILMSFDFILLPLALISVIPVLFIEIFQGKEIHKVKLKQVVNKNKRDDIWKLFIDQKSIKEMKAYGCGTFLKQKWELFNNQVLEELVSVQRKYAKNKIIVNSLKVLCYVISILLAIYLTFIGRLQVGQLGACFIAFSSTQFFSAQLLSKVGRIISLLPFATDYYNFIDSEKEEKCLKQATPFTNGIKLENVFFNYPNSTVSVLNDITVSVKSGEKVAIVGENGSGKTTLTKILSGAYPASAGKVLFDNVDSISLDKTTIYNQISVVTQNFIQYHLSLRDNIGLADPDRLDQDTEILHALKLADANDLLDLPEGLDTCFGREFGGVELSGGQWQRIAIARGFFRKSKILILDEPTSALDPIIENDLLQKILELASNKTTIIVSHRVGLCTNVDRIIFMQNGKITEDGSHEELINKHGEYEKFYYSQQQWYQQSKSLEE